MTDMTVANTPLSMSSAPLPFAAPTFSSPLSPPPRRPLGRIRNQEDFGRKLSFSEEMENRK